MKFTTTMLCCLLAVSVSACDKKEDKKEAPKTADKKAEATPEATPEAEAKPEVKAPELEPLALADWSITLQVPKGAKVDEMDAGDAEMEMPDTAKLTTEDACGYDIDLSRHWSKSLDSMYDTSKKATEGLTEVEFIKDEKTETGYTIHYKGKAPLGEMFGASTGLVVGDRLVLCDAGLGRLEEAEAACVLAVCSSITEGEAAAGDAKADAAKAEGDAEADAEADAEKADG